MRDSVKPFLEVNMSNRMLNIYSTRHAIVCKVLEGKLTSFVKFDSLDGIIRKL